MQKSQNSSSLEKLKKNVVSSSSPLSHDVPNSTVDLTIESWSLSQEGFLNFEDPEID
jgi:hypothetical protein